MTRLANRTILITGASQGLGAEIACSYANQGATVILLGRNNQRLARIYDRIVAMGAPEPFAISFDLFTAKEAEFNALAEEIIKNTGNLDGIVHCASYLYALSPVAHQTVDEWANQYRINTVAPMGLTRAFLPWFAQKGQGNMIFVGHDHSEKPAAYWAAFGASQAGLNYFCQSLADEYSRFEHIFANVLIPGAINSPQRQKTHPGETGEERIPISSLMDDFVNWMASPSSSGNIVYLTKS